ncbi:MAG: hypothetical protein ACREPG_06300, partial [Candidatus Binatia bacterium]
LTTKAKARRRPGTSSEIYRKERNVRKSGVRKCRGVLRYARVHGEEHTIDFTTKDTKITKFGILIIRTLSVLRALRGEDFFTVNPEVAKL